MDVAESEPSHQSGRAMKLAFRALLRGLYAASGARTVSKRRSHPRLVRIYPPPDAAAELPRAELCASANCGIASPLAGPVDYLF